MLCFTGVPTLDQLQRSRKEMKRVKKGPTMLQDLHDLKILALEHTQPLQLMPPAGTAVGTAATAVRGCPPRCVTS